MPKRRTEEEKFADSFDLKLFNLMGQAAARKGPWMRISLALRAVRPMVRGMMHHEDRKETA